MSYYQNDSPAGGYGGGGGNRKRGRDFDDEGGSANYGGGRRQQRRFNDYDQPIAPYGGRDYSDMGGRSGGYHGGGGGRRGRGRGGPRYSNYNNDRDHHSFQPLLSAGEKYSIDLWRLGDVIPDAKVDEASRFTSTSKEDVQGIAEETKDLWAKGSKEEILRAFRIAIAECPHKLPYYATVLSLLANETFTPPPARIPAKPLVTITNPSAAGDSSTATNGEAGGDEEMKAASSVPNTPAPVQSVNIGLEIVKDLVKVFQNHLDARRWRSVRFCLHMFANLATLPKPLISITSLLSLLNQSFIFVLENEFSLRAERGDELVRVVLETLLRIPGEYLQGQNESETLEAIRNGLGNYMGSRSLDLSFLGDKINEEQWIDPLQQLYEAFTSSTGQALFTLPRPYEQFPQLTGEVAAQETTETNGEGSKEAYTPEAFNLPVISLPIDTDEDTVPASAKLPGSARIATTVSAAAAAPGESDDWAREPVGYSGVRAGLAFFTDETVPSGNTFDGLYLRQLMVDVLNVYEVNRKDCARILLNDLPKWLPEGVFKSAAAKGTQPAADEMTTDTSSTVIKEHTLMDVILSQMLSTPNSPQRSIYYYSLITELCKLSPSTVAPALGKCIRKLYAGLGLSDEEAGKDVIVLGPEGIRRYSDWMATHLSNFGFHWRWPEWQDDLALPLNHPKKVFIARVLDLETRLSYHERIKSTLPEEYLSSSAGVFPSEAPAPDFTYETEGPSPYQNAASDLLGLMRSKATSAEIKEHLEKLKADFVAGEIGDEPIDEEAAERRARDILFQCILVIGSRSFSHYLNVLERYIVILRDSTNSASARIALLRSATRFWSSNTLFRHIVFDKLLQYRIVDPIDVLTFVFEGEELVLDGEVTPRDWSDISIWDIFRMTLEKVQNRVLAVTLRLENLRKREENRMDTERAAAGEMKTDENDDGTRADGQGEAKITDEQAAVEVANVERQVEAVKKEQESLFVDVVRKWNETLTAVQGSEDPWSAWFANGWFNEFCRAFAGDLTRQLDALAHVELPSEGPVYQGLAAAQRWIEFV